MSKILKALKGRSGREVTAHLNDLRRALRLTDYSTRAFNQELKDLIERGKVVRVIDDTTHKVTLSLP